MKKLLVATLMALTAGAVMAQATDDAKARREAVKNMTPDEKAAKKAEMKAKWDAMSPEEQAEAKKKFAKENPKAAKRIAEKKAAGETVK